jgi:hypothetical protein
MITFVSAFFLTAVPKRELDTYKADFEKMAATGIPIVLFLDEQLDWVFSENVRVTRTRFSDTWIHHTVPDDAILPEERAHYDTLPYMKIQHSKTEWMVRAIEANPFQTEWFAWVDFALPHVFWDPETVRRLPTLKPPSHPCLVTPGIWPYSLEGVWDRVQWRFAGGFLLGHASMFQLLDIRLKDLVRRVLPKFSWEVNYWAMLERDGIPFGWFQANHNDSMITAVPGQDSQDPVVHPTEHSQGNNAQ